MNIPATAAIAASGINAGLACFVFLANPRSRLARIYVAWGGCVAVWNLAAFVLCLPETTHHRAEVWIRILQAAVIFLPLTLAHLCHIVVSGQPPAWLKYFYGLHLGMAMSLFGTLFVKDVQLLRVGWWSVAGPLFWVYLASYAVLTLPLMVNLPRRAAASPPPVRARIRALWLAFLTLWLLGSNDMMPILGFARYPGTGVDFVPLGNIGAIFYGVMVAYSVLQHQLLDVHLALSRLAASLARLLFVFVIGAGLLFVVSVLLPGSLNESGFAGALAALVASIAIAGALFPKLLGGSSERVERALMGDRFELPEKVRAFIDQMRWHTESGPLAAELEKFLAGAFRVRRMALIGLDEARRAFVCMRAMPSNLSLSEIEFHNESAVFAHFLTSKSRILFLGDGYSSEDETRSAAQAREELAGTKADVAFGLIHGDTAVGVLLIGDRAGARSMTAGDLTHLGEIADNLAMFLHQISLKRQVLLNQELDLLGRMSRGLAHDLNNLMTPVWTLLQLLNEGAPAEAIRTELAPIAMRNIQSMRLYIREALFFSEHLRPDMEMGRLAVLIQSVVESAKQSQRKGKRIKYNVVLSGEATVEMDQALVQRLLANLLNNAIDASPDGALITVELKRLTRSEAHREWYRVRIEDQGSGIPPELLGRIFQPYFSTKKTGDDDRGFGLGLPICRKIAVMHGGHLNVTSSPGNGTTVSLDLPSRQNTDAAPQEIPTVASPERHILTAT